MPRYRHAYLDTPAPRAFAHRGAALGCAENSREAVAGAARLGFRYLETDVQATRDGVAVLYHDATTDRLLGRPGRIADLDWSEIRAATLRGGGRVARLDEVLADHPDLRINIDAKTDDVVAPLGDAISAARALDRVLVSSFDGRRTRALRDRFGAGLCWSPAAPGVAAMWAAGWGLPHAAETAPCYQIPTLWRGIPLTTARFVAAVHARGAEVHIWTVDDPAEMTRLLDLGIDGLMTDRPGALMDVLARRGHWQGAPARAGGGDA